MLSPVQANDPAASDSGTDPALFGNETAAANPMVEVILRKRRHCLPLTADPPKEIIS
jgi:hypothetical protein